MSHLGRRQFLALGAAAALAGCVAPRGILPASDAPLPQGPLSHIGFGSCVDQSLPQGMWNTILADRPELFIFGGDTVYADHSPRFSVEELRRAYAAEAAVPGFARMRATVPHLALWDDGDYGLNDGGADFPYKQQSKDEFLKFWNAPPDDPRRSHGGLYAAHAFGPPGQRVQVLLLETRWFRSPWKRTDVRDAPGKERYVPDADPAKTLLGDEQWRWLEARLREPADVRLVVSGIQVIVEGHGWERWGNFPRERDRLFRLIAETGANGVVLLSGDRHFGAFYRQERGAPYPMYEMTASGITHSWTDAREAGPNRVGELFTGLNFGTIDIDWSARALQLSIKDIQGVKQRVQRLSLEELKVKS